MAIKGGFKAEFDDAFPHGAYVVGEVIEVFDFEASTKDKRVQARDKESNLPVWQVPVMDPDPEARKGQRELTVKVAATHQPVPPEAIPGTPFRPVEFIGLVVTPWVDDRSGRPRIAFSLRASGMQAPASSAPASRGKNSEAA